MSNNRIFLSPPHMSGREIEYVKEAFESNYIAPLGPQVDAFESEFSEYAGIKYSAAVSSGNAAMHLALRHLSNWTRGRGVRFDADLYRERDAGGVSGSDTGFH